MKWWVYIYGKLFMVAVNMCFKVIIGHGTIIADQERFETMISDIRDMGGIIGPMRGFRLLAVVEDTELLAKMKDSRGIYLEPIEDVFNF